MITQDSVQVKYCKHILSYHRRKTREVMVGDVGIGGDNPVRIQSMTISDTLDTAATVAEAAGLARAGCEIVRITAPSMKEAQNLKNIKRELLRRDINVPLVADIHFTPNAALIAAEHVEKVRINPGNYADKKKFEQREYTDDEYEAELARIEEKFKPLVLKCKDLKRAMRIGTNHGSLSDRIMNRYGDTAEGMVESALEFVKICEKYDFRSIVLSMKSSNPIVAVQAYRLLAARMEDLGMDYPFHLGVTEAGDGAEARIKSAIGIGGLLEDGIGDTIRVSLTEDAIAEIPVARRLARRYNRLEAEGGGTLVRSVSSGVPSYDPFQYRRRDTLSCKMLFRQIGGSEVPLVELTLKSSASDLAGAQAEIGRMLGRPLNGRPALVRPDGMNKAEVLHTDVASQRDLNTIQDLRHACWQNEFYPDFALHVNSDCNDILMPAGKLADRIVVNADRSDARAVVEAASYYDKPVEWLIVAGENDSGLELMQKIDRYIPGILDACILEDFWHVLFSLSIPPGLNGIVHPHRYLAFRLNELGANLPIILRYHAVGNYDNDLLNGAAQLGVLLCDGIGDSLHIDSIHPHDDILSLQYNILQATRLRISKTEYISCPSCGRTLFDLQTTTERIKSKTEHLKGVKIAIMGCIVNGPGEMADADFGYVGSGPQTVNLFVGQECVERNIPEGEADDRLITLIKQNDRWFEPD